MNLRAIREALADIGESFGFAPYSILVENPSPPAIVVSVPDVEYGASLRRSKITIPVIIVVSRSDMEAGQTLLDAAMSTQAESLVDAYNDAQDSAWVSCRVVSTGNVREVSLGSASALAADITLEIIA